MKKLKILALEPYYGGSHKAFLDTWIAGSCHEWTLLTLPPTKWKWRMMHSAMSFADELNNSPNHQITKLPNVIFCSDMLDLARFKGLLSANFANVPIIAYFHENQLTYPTEYPKERDLHFALSNITTALAADRIWFNSAFHMNEFLEASARFAKKASDNKPFFITEQIKAKSEVVPQGIKKFPKREKNRKEGPIRILWAHRWEFDKDPETFFKAIRILKKRRNCDFRISVLGGHAGHAGHADKLFGLAEKEFSDLSDYWGYVDSYDEYCRILGEVDIAVSTSKHEFFGIGIAEAVSAGAFPLVPNRLAYPEILVEDDLDKNKEGFFYEGNHKQLAEKLFRIIQLISNTGSPWQGDEGRGIRKIERFYWNKLIPKLDEKVGQFC
jgi:glycosyltransferase involved in cell wall biosynthesis